MSLASGYTATLTVDRPAGQADISLIFEKWEGGELAGDGNKHRNPITRKETARGGLSSRGDLTLTTECDSAVWAVIDDLEDSVLKDKVSAVRQMVGPRSEVIGEPETRTGLIASVQRPPYDLESSDTGMLVVVIHCDE